MNRRQTKKALKKALAEVKRLQDDLRFFREPQPPTLQEAWDIVAAHLSKQGHVCYFVDRTRGNGWELHTAGEYNRPILTQSKGATK
jgi:hypothetical protein